MRFVLYNMRYAAGTGLRFHFPFPYSGYLKRTRANIGKIGAFLYSLKPDIVGLLEVDNGSHRTGRVSQAAEFSRILGFRHVYRSKYADNSFIGRAPIMKEQGNAVLTNQIIESCEFHYFQEGWKRLVIELELPTCVLFLVHLSLRYRHRQYQLGDLYSLFARVKKPAIVAGDMNAFWGDRELQFFLAASGLRNANRGGIPTYPSRYPRRQLDFILHSRSIKVNRFFLPPVLYSDHLPLVCDFEVHAADGRANPSPV